LITVSIPVKNVLGDIQGTLIAEINLKFMWDLVDQLKVGETGYAYVVDNEGRLIAYGDTARVLRGENVQHIPEVQEFLENPTAAEDITPDIVAYIGLTGEKVVGRYIPLGTPEWAVFTEVPYSEAYKPTYRALTIFVLATLVMIFLAELAGVIVAKRLTVPLIALTGTATRIADGELNLKATMGGTKEIASLALAFNTMTTQLQESIGSLEQRVADRTKALATSADISRRISTILDRQQLIDEVVERVNSSFNYYHTQIYFYDETGSELQLAGGTGEAGKALLEHGHKVMKGAGLVGRAAETNSAVIVSDVSSDPRWLPNPLLPETKSEIAVPISSGDTVIGVLDVQHMLAGGLTKEDADVLQSIANQIMIAAQNGRLLIAAQKRAEREALISSINQKIQSTNTVETALQVAVREVGRALKARTSVHLTQTGEE
jgi:putative methionine-R-sulfoxide reductase with GAF domain